MTASAIFRKHLLARPEGRACNVCIDCGHDKMTLSNDLRSSLSLSITALLVLLLLLDGVTIRVRESLLLHHRNSRMYRIQIVLGSAVRVVVLVCPGKVLAVVAGEIEVVECMVSWRVDPFLPPTSGNHIAVVDKDCPELDEDKEEEVGPLVHGADVDEDAGHKRVVYLMMEQDKVLEG